MALGDPLAPATPNDGSEPAPATPQPQLTPQLTGDVAQRPTLADYADAADHIALQRLLLSRIRSRNIAAELTEEHLSEIGQTVLREYKIDEESCADWKDRTERAHELAMQVAQEKTYPWPGASNVIFPLMTTAAMQFAARAYPAIVAGSDVVRGKVVGDDSGEPAVAKGLPVKDPQGQQVWIMPPGAKQVRADRVGEHMSWQLLDEQPEWEDDTDKLLHQLPIVGCCFRKSYFDPVKGRNVSLMVPAMALCINYKAKSVETAPRLTEHVPLYPIEIEEAVRAQTFLAHDYGLPSGADGDEDAPHLFLEQHRRIDLDEDGYAEPYIVTVHKETGKVARIVAGFDVDTVFFRNPRMPERLFSLADLSGALERFALPPRAFADMDLAKIDRVEYYTPYNFLPSMDGGIYGTGFGNLLRPINEAVNTTLNQMLDAGHLANTGGGFIGKGLSMAAGAVRFQIGEWKSVNVAGGNIRENLVSIPFPGPSAVLFQLLGLLIEAGKEIAAIKDVLAGDVNGQNMQPTTVLALIEQGLKVFTAIYKRVYRSLKLEYKKLYRLNRLNLPIEGAHFKRGDAQFHVTRQDYADDMMVEPVADPRTVSDMQRLTRAQFLLTFANDPMFNGMEIRKSVLEAAQIDRPERYLLPMPPPNPEMLAKMVEWKQKAVQLQADAGRQKAAEIRDYAQAIFYLAQAAKLEGDQRLAWLDQQLETMRLHFETLTSAYEQGMQTAQAGQQPGAPGAPGGGPAAAPGGAPA